MENLVYVKQIEDPQRMKMVCMKMKEHASLWWYTMQLERKSKGNDRIMTWDRIVVKLKGKFLPINYTLNLKYRNLQSLRQKDMTVKEYIYLKFTIS